jgi:hypothetical protein
MPDRAPDQPNCTAIFEAPGGVQTSRQLVAGLSALMGDLAAGRITNGRPNAICDEAGKLLTAVKRQRQRGSKTTDSATGPTPARRAKRKAAQ